MIALFAGLVWLVCTGPSMHWLDSSELACAACSLGVGHPPGQVPHAMTGFLFSVLPIGDCSFRVSLVSLLGSLTGAFAFERWWAKRLPTGWSPDRIDRRLIRGLLFGVMVSPLFLVQAVRAEVYGLSLGLTALAVLAAGRREDFRWECTAWFLWGAAMCNHPVIGLAALPFLIRRPFRVLPPAFVLVAACVLVYLPLRAARPAAWDFGDPADLSSLIWFLRGKLYKAYENPSIHGAFDHLVTVVEQMIRTLSPVGMCLAAGGIIGIVLREPHAALRSLTALALGVLPLVTMTNYSPMNPDTGGYLLPSLCILWSFLATGFLWVSRRLPSRKLKFLLALAVLVPCLHEFYRVAPWKPDWSALSFSRFLASEPLATGTVRTASFTTFSFLRYGQIIEGLRPDLRVDFRGLKIPSNVRFRTGAGRGEGPEYWEPSLEMSRSGTFGLREEDLRRLTRLQPGGWFFVLNPRRATGPIGDYAENLREIASQVPPLYPYAKEPLLLNALLQILVARGQHDIVREHEMMDFVSSTFPDFQELKAMETKF